VPRNATTSVSTAPKRARVTTNTTRAGDANVSLRVNVNGTLASIGSTYVANNAYFTFFGMLNCVLQCDRLGRAHLPLLQVSHRVVVFGPVLTHLSMSNIVRVIVESAITCLLL
jgi:hypothetical protein